MAVHFHALKIKRLIHETSDAVSIEFDVPEALRSEFEFEQGQNITIKKLIDGEEIRRSYSICSAPYENKLTIAVKQITGGKFSNYALQELKAGDELDILPPTGKFNTRLDSGNKKNYLAIAAGSGITPIISIIKATLKAEPESNFTLVFGNRGRHSILFFEALEGLKNKYINRFNLIHILSREATDTPVNSGRIDEAKLKELSQFIAVAQMDEYFICGPEAMIFCAKDFLTEQAVPLQKIHFELFTTPGQTQSAARNNNQKNKDEGPTSKVTLKLDGRSFDFTLGYNGASLLDAALQQGADLPFACKGGVCCTCKAKLLSGQVKMDVNWGLEQEEIEQGYILTCQSHPITEKIVVDFDIK
jgi:ring-1,2-phenylacetyl-CoA epoxidase subunit PaaE